MIENLNQETIDALEQAAKVGEEKRIAEINKGYDEQIKGLELLNMAEIEGFESVLKKIKQLPQEELEGLDDIINKIRLSETKGL